MINGCVTSKSSSPSSPISMMSPSSLHSSPQASSSFSQDRSPVSSPSRTTFQSVPLLKPSAIKDPSVHFPPSTLPSMCFPLHAIYAQNPYSGIVGSNLSTFFSPHAIARQMSFLGNTFSQNLSGKRIPAEDFSRFPPVFSPLNAGHRTGTTAYPTAKQGCLFPFNSGGHNTGGHPLHNSQNNMFNALNNECLTSSPPFKRKMLNISGDTDLSTSTPNDSPAVQSTSIGSNNWCRSPSQPLSCPLCSISLEGIDIRSHFYEEVHKVETLRKLSDFAYHPNDSSESNERFESRCSSFQKKLPYSRWETFQRVKQNRHSRLTAMIRQTRKKFETEELRPESGVNPLLRAETIWNIGSDVSTTSQRMEDEDENDSSSEKNVDVVSDGADNDKEADCEKSNEGSNHGLQQHNRDSSETKAGNDVTDGLDVKPLENGLSPQQSNIQNNSDNIENIQDIHETIYLLRKRIRELENKENDSANNDTFRSLPSMA